MEKAVISSGAAGFLAAGAYNLSATPLGLPIGSQVWPTRSMIKDFPAYVKMMPTSASLDSNFVTRLVTAPNFHLSRMEKKSRASSPISA